MTEKEIISSPYEEQTVAIVDSINKLRRDVENTTNFRKDICEKMGLSLNTNENNAVQNYFLGIIDGMMEFPTFIELYINNLKFRELFWNELKNLSILDFSNAISEIGTGLLEGGAYEKGRSSIKSIFLLTGIGGILRQFGITIAKKGASITLLKVGLGASMTGFHATGYALGQKGEDVVKAKLSR